MTLDALTAAIATRLRNQQVATEVINTLALDRIQRTRRLPALVVYPLRERVADNRAPASGAIQKVTTDIGIAAGVSTAPDSTGTMNTSVMAPAIDATITALAGWCPSTDAAPLSYTSGEILPVEDYEQERVWWLTVFSTTRWLSAQLS